MINFPTVLEAKENADRAPSLRCEITHEAWGPHEGCREFMAEPDVFPCGGWATVRLVWVEESGWEPSGYHFGAILLCADDVSDYIDMILHDPYGKVLALSITHIASQTIDPEEGK